MLTCVFGIQKMSWEPAPNVDWGEQGRDPLSLCERVPMAAAARGCRALASDGTRERTCSGAGSHHGAWGSFWRLWLHQLLLCPASARARVPRFLPPPPRSKPAVVGQVQGLLLLPSSHLRTLW